MQTTHSQSVDSVSVFASKSKMMKYFRFVLMPGLTLSLQTAAAVLMAYLAAGTAENPTFAWEVCFAAAGIFSGIIAGGAVADLLQAEGIRNSDMLSRLTGTSVGLLLAVLILLFLGPVGAFGLRAVLLAGALNGYYAAVFSDLLRAEN